MYIIENNSWRASFEAKGAELGSLFHKPSSKELMWQADPRFWPKTSPILFPIVGALKNNRYRYKGKDFTLSRHGFARDRNFDVTTNGDTFIEFVLRDDYELSYLFPFEFELCVRYELSEKGFCCSYKVINLSLDSPLLFSLGGHPAFAVEVNDVIAYDDYQLIFPKDEILTVKRLRNNLLVEEESQIKLINNALDLSYSLFYDDALVIKNLNSQQLVLTNRLNHNKLIFAFDGFPYFGLWAAKDADFICLEPWAGIADYENHNSDLLRKEGIIKLLPGSAWNAEWKVSFEAGHNKKKIN